MRLGPYVALCLLLPAIGASATQPATVYVHTELPENGFVAFRMNISEDHDLTWRSTLHVCPLGTEQVVELVGASIWNGRATTLGKTVSWVATGASAGVAGHFIETGLQGSGCKGIAVYVHPGAASPGTHTLILVPAGAPGSFSMELWFTRGVTWDLATGQGVALRAEEMGGAHANAMGGHAGIGGTVTLTPERDFIGGFSPPGGQNKVVESACARDGADACYPLYKGDIAMISKGPTRWDLTLGAAIAEGGRPTHAVRGVELPDDSYLVDDVHRFEHRFYE